MNSACRRLTARPPVRPDSASHRNASCRPCPLSKRLGSRRCCTHSRARVSSRLWSRIQSGSRSAALMRRSTRSSRPSRCRTNSQFGSCSAGGTAFASVSRQTRGAMRFFASTANRNSLRQARDVTESGLRMNTKTSAASIAAAISFRHGARAPMFFKSSQASRPRVAKPRRSLRAKTLSSRAYEMKN